MMHELLFFLKIFLYLAVLDLRCGTQDLVPQPGIEPRPPAMEVQSLNHWTAQEVPQLCSSFTVFITLQYNGLICSISYVGFYLSFPPQK